MKGPEPNKYYNIANIYIIVLKNGAGVRGLVVTNMAELDVSSIERT